MSALKWLRLRRWRWSFPMTMRGGSGVWGGKFAVNHVRPFQMPAEFLCVRFSSNAARGGTPGLFNSMTTCGRQLTKPTKFGQAGVERAGDAELADLQELIVRRVL